MKRIVLVALIAFAGCKGGSESSEVPDTPQTQPTIVDEDTSAPPSSDAGVAGDAAIKSDVEVAEVAGKEVYGRVCITCHGKTGDGKGLEQELFSFAAPANEWKHSPSVDGILITLQAGVHDTSMQAFPDYGDAERRAVAEYVLVLRERLLEEQGEPAE